MVIDYTGKALIYYTESNSNYSLNQTIDLGFKNSSWAGAITDDHMYLFAGVKNVIKVFEYDGTEYVFLYNITVSESEVRDIAITNDY